MSKITMEYLKEKHYNGEAVSGVTMLRDVRRSLTKAKKPFFTGSILSGVDIGIKVWDNVPAFETLTNNDLVGKLVTITGTWNEYNGSLSIVVDVISEYNGTEYSINDFLEVVYNKDAYLKGLISLCNGMLSEDGMKIANATLFENSEVLDAFSTEFAAKSHHDNCLSGLLAHTYKMVYLAQVVQSLYKDIVDKDIFVLGVLLHDIGKIREMHFGKYHEISKVTHRFLGVEMLPKDLIVETYGESWYYELVSILLQHHGEFGDPCRTVTSYLVNQIDKLDAMMTLIHQTLKLDESAESINIDGNFLSVFKRGE